MGNRIRLNGQLYEEVDYDDWISERNLPSFRGWNGPIRGNAGWFSYEYKICPDISIGFRDWGGELQVGIVMSIIDISTETTEYEASVTNVKAIMNSNVVNRLVKPLANELKTFDGLSPATTIAYLVNDPSLLDKVKGLIDNIEKGFMSSGMRKNLTKAS